MANIKLTEEVTDVLVRSTITENQLVLPSGKLERKLYEAVNKAIVAAGGKWNKSAQAHVFPGDPMSKLGLMLETGVAIDEKKLYQSFYTPKELAETIVRMADVSGHKCLEPSCGDGGLISEMLRQGAKEVHGIEIREEEANKAKMKGASTITVGDFLQQKIPTSKFERIVMNPPFTKNQDIKHVSHALKFLEPGGILVTVMLPRIDRNKFKDLLEGFEHDIQPVPAGMFKGSGTNISTIILRLWT